MVFVNMQISEALGWTLIHLLWEGAILAATLGVVLVLTRSPRVRYAAGCTALVATLANFIITLIHFWPERGGSVGMVMKQMLPSGLARPDANLSYGRDGDFGAWVAWLGPLWLVGVCVFYLRCAVGCLSVYKMRFLEWTPENHLRHSRFVGCASIGIRRRSRENKTTRTRLI